MRNIIIISMFLLFLILITGCNPFLTEETYQGGILAISASSTENVQIQVTDSGRLDRIKSVKLYGFNHPTAGDLKVSLQSPAGTVVLIDKEGDSKNFNGDYTYVDKDSESGLSRIPNVDPVVPDIYQSNSSFDLRNDPVSGYWTLFVENSGTDIGTITSWEVTVSIDSY